MRARSTVCKTIAAHATVFGLVVGGCDTAGPPSRVFVADSAHAAIATLVDPDPSPGMLAVDRIISGNLTGLSGGLRRLSLDAANDRLYAAVGNSIYAFGNVGTADGNVTSHLVFGGASDSDTSVFLDAAHDRLYVTGITGNIKVIDNASTATTASPTRTITGDFGDSPILSDATVDVGRDILYVLVTSSSFPFYLVVSFDGASSLNGAAHRSRAIVTGQITNGSLYLDESNDRLYVSGAGGEIAIYEDAHTRGGVTPADRFISFPADQVGITVDTGNDRMYGVSDKFGFIVNDVSLFEGPFTGVIVTAPAGSRLTAVAVSQ